MVSTQLHTASETRATAIEQSLRSIIRGNDEVVRMAMVCVLARG